MNHKFKVGDLVKINPEYSYRFERRWNRGVAVVKTVYWDGSSYSIARITSGGREERRYIGNRRYLRPVVLNMKLEDYF